jgi:phage baseplate assembly protein gpV
MKRSALLLVLLVAAAVTALGFEKTQVLTLPAEGIAKLEVTAGAGFLRVSGVEGARAVEVKAAIVVTGVGDKDMEGYIKDRVELELRKAGNAAVLVGRIRDHGFSFVPRDARVDLTVTVPKGLAVEIDDGSGELAVSGVAGDVRIKDGSGSIEVRDIGGSLWIDDGSGEIEVDGVQGNVEIIDGSGETDVRNVAGDLSIDDGSGGTTLRKIGGSVTVEDGSGSLEIDDVGKDVRIRHKGSGSLDIQNVKGKVIR